MCSASAEKPPEAGRTAARAEMPPERIPLTGIGPLHRCPIGEEDAGGAGR